MQRVLNAAQAGAPDLEQASGRDLVELARYLVPLEAALVQGCLVAGGVPAVLADAHLVQTDLLLAPALGGVRILVPHDHLVAGQAVLAAFERGEFELGEDADVGGPASKTD
jgi:hypothetical protein